MALVTFSELLEDAFIDPDRVDYALLRELYVHSPSYLPFGRDERAVARLHQELASERFEEAVETVESLLVVDPLSIALRLAYAHALDGIDDDWEAATQRAFANGLIKAMLRSGDGRSEATAIVVLDERERSLTLELLDLQAKTSRTHRHDGAWYEHIECLCGRELILDVSWPQGWLMAMASS